MTVPISDSDNTPRSEITTETTRRHFRTFVEKRDNFEKDYKKEQYGILRQHFVNTQELTIER